MGRVLPHEERLLTARAAIAIARKRHRPSAPTEVEGSRRLKSEDWLLQRTGFDGMDRSPFDNGLYGPRWYV